MFENRWPTEERFVRCVADFDRIDCFALAIIKTDIEEIIGKVFASIILLVNQTQWFLDLNVLNHLKFVKYATMEIVDWFSLLIDNWGLFEKVYFHAGK